MWHMKHIKRLCNSGLVCMHAEDWVAVQRLFAGYLVLLAEAYVLVFVWWLFFCSQPSSLSGILSVSAVAILAAGIPSLRCIYWHYSPSFPGQLFNYPGLLIVAGTQHSEAEAGPAPVNDWLFHHGPLGPSRRPRDRRSPKQRGYPVLQLHPHFSSPDCATGSK